MVYQTLAAPIPFETILTTPFIFQDIQYTYKFGQNKTPGLSWKSTNTIQISKLGKDPIFAYLYWPSFFISVLGKLLEL